MKNNEVQLVNETINEERISTIFSFESLDKANEIHVNMRGVSKENIKWKARELQEIDRPNYEKLLTDRKVMRFLKKEGPLTNEEIEDYIFKFKQKSPLGVFTVLNEENDDFIGYVILGSPWNVKKEKGVCEIAHGLFPEYWNKGIGQSVLKKVVEEWGLGVRRIGLGIGSVKNNKKHETIKELFSCFDGSELRKFYATAHPINLATCVILEKNGFEPVKEGVENIDNPFSFVGSLDELEDYIKNLFHQEKKIESDKLYSVMIKTKTDEIAKKYTFNIKVNLNNKIRFHYEKILI